jgi:hypothetical protein
MDLIGLVSSMDGIWSFLIDSVVWILWSCVLINILDQSVRQAISYKYTPFSQLINYTWETKSWHRNFCFVDKLSFLARNRLLTLDGLYLVSCYTAKMSVQ